MKFMKNSNTVLYVWTILPTKMDTLLVTTVLTMMTLSINVGSFTVMTLLHVRKVVLPWVILKVLSLISTIWEQNMDKLGMEALPLLALPLLVPNHRQPIAVVAMDTPHQGHLPPNFLDSRPMLTLPLMGYFSLQLSWRSP